MFSSKAPRGKPSAKWFSARLGDARRADQTSFSSPLLSLVFSFAESPRPSPEPAGRLRRSRSGTDKNHEQDDVAETSVPPTTTTTSRVSLEMAAWNGDVAALAAWRQAHL